MDQHKVLGPHEVDGIVRPKLASSTKKSKKEVKRSEDDIVEEVDEKKDKKSKKNKKKRDVEENPEENVVDEIRSSKKQKGDDTENVEEDTGLELSEENELTLEARLEMLSKQMNQLEDENQNNDQPNDSAQLPSAQSLVTLLEQALQSGDEGLLEQCLSCNNQQMIALTTQELSTSKVLVFLKKLIAKFEKRPTRGQLITVWLANVLKYHISYLITVPDLSRQLAALSTIIEHRLSNHSKLVALAGRLDLLMAQITANHGKNNQNSNIEPAIIYEEND